MSKKSVRNSIYAFTASFNILILMSETVLIKTKRKSLSMSQKYMMTLWALMIILFFFWKTSSFCAKLHMRIFFFFDNQCLIFCLFIFSSVSLQVNAFYAFYLFETDDAFHDSHMIISFIIQHHQLRIKTLILIDNEIFEYVFIDVIFTQKHHLFLHCLCYFCCLEEFDNQSALMNVITHVVKITLILDHHVKKMFFYVTNLK